MLSRKRGTASRWRLAERRCRRVPALETGMQCSDRSRWCAAVRTPVNRHCQLDRNSWLRPCYYASVLYTGLRDCPAVCRVAVVPASESDTDWMIRSFSPPTPTGHSLTHFCSSSWLCMRHSARVRHRGGMCADSSPPGGSLRSYMRWFLPAKLWRVMVSERKCGRYNWHSAGSLSWPLPTLKYY